MPLQTNLANGVSTNNINHGNLSGVDWTKFTVGGWWTPTTVTLADRAFFSKGVSGGARLRVFQTNFSLGSIRLAWIRATTNVTYNTTGGYLVANKPICIFVTGDQAATPVIHIYTRYLNTPLAEAGYAVTTNGSGAFTSIAARPFRVNASEVPDIAFSGMVHHLWVFENRILEIDKMTQLSENYNSFRSMKPSLAARYGSNGTGMVLDESGNNFHGTLTSAYPVNNNLPIVSRRSLQ